MSIPYHTHNFQLPTATKRDVTEGTSDTLIVTPAALGSAAAHNYEEFASIAGVQAIEREVDGLKDQAQQLDNEVENATRLANDAQQKADLATTTADKATFIANDAQQKAERIEQALEAAKNDISNATNEAAKALVETQKNKAAIAQNQTAISKAQTSADQAQADANKAEQTAGNTQKLAMGVSNKVTKLAQTTDDLKGTIDAVAGLAHTNKEAIARIKPLDTQDWVRGTKSDEALISPQKLLEAIRGNAGGSGGGNADMSATIYDPRGVRADVFSMDNMVEGSDKLILTASERTNIASIEFLKRNIADTRNNATQAKAKADLANAAARRANVAINKIKDYIAAYNRIESLQGKTYSPGAKLDKAINNVGYDLFNQASIGYRSIKITIHELVLNTGSNIIFSFNDIDGLNFKNSMSTEAFDTRNSNIVSSLNYNDALYFFPKSSKHSEIGRVKAIKELEMDITIHENNRATIKTDGILEVCGGANFDAAMDESKATIPFIDTHVRSTYFIDVPFYQNNDIQGAHVLRRFSIISDGGHIIRTPDFATQASNLIYSASIIEAK